MSIVTKNVSNYVKSKGINLSLMSRKTNIPYGVLIASLGENPRDRELRADEFLAICGFLEINPLDFAGKKE